MNQTAHISLQILPMSNSADTTEQIHHIQRQNQPEAPISLGATRSSYLKNSSLPKSQSFAPISRPLPIQRRSAAGEGGSSSNTIYPQPPFLCFPPFSQKTIFMLLNQWFAYSIKPNPPFLRHWHCPKPPRLTVGHTRSWAPIIIAYYSGQRLRPTFFPFSGSTMTLTGIRRAGQAFAGSKPACFTPCQAPKRLIFTGHHFRTGVRCDSQICTFVQTPDARAKGCRVQD
jgi:hypothetical protein